VAIVESIRPLLAISCPFICVFLIVLFSKRPNIRESCTIFASILQFLIIFSMVPIIIGGNVIECPSLYCIYGNGFYIQNRCFWADFRFYFFFLVDSGIVLLHRIYEVAARTRPNAILCLFRFSHFRCGRYSNV